MQTAPAGKGLSITGTAWIDAASAPEGTVVQALVDDVVCGEGTVVSNPATASLALSFSMSAAAATDKAGCGGNGVNLSFTVGGKPAKEKLAWDTAAAAAGQPASIDLSAGEPFAAYSGSYLVNGGPVSSGSVLDVAVYDPLHPDVAGVVCGSIIVGKGEGLSKANPTSYAYLVALPDSLKKGCGREGTQVVLRVDGCVLDNVPWEPGFHKLNLTKPSLCVPSPTTGDSAGASQPSGIAAPSSGNAAEADTPGVRVWWAVIAGSGLLTLLGSAGLMATMRRSRKA